MRENKLCEAIRQVAWAYIVIHVHINLGTIGGTMDVFADWLGYVWIWLALPVLGEEIPAARLLRPLTVALASWTFITWTLNLVGISLSDSLGYLEPLEDVIYVVVHLYFHFQLLTNLAQLADKYQCRSEGWLLHLRTIRTIIATLFSLQIPWQNHNVLYGISMGIAVIHILAALCISKALFNLRKELWSRLQASQE